MKEMRLGVELLVGRIYVWDVGQSGSVSSWMKELEGEELFVGSGMYYRRSCIGNY